MVYLKKPSYRKGRLIILKALKNILVCVTQQKTCERLILSSNEYRTDPESELFVLHVAKNDWNFLDNAKEGEALEYLFKISKTAGANMTVIKSDTIADTIAEFAQKNHIGIIVMGASPETRHENNFFDELQNILPDVKICIIPQT